MAQYELMMILNQNDGEAATKETLSSVQSLLAEAGATISKEDIWGDKKMAYKIKGSDRGYYILWTLELDGKAIKALSSKFNLNTNIWRYMFVNLED